MLFRRDCPKHLVIEGISLVGNFRSQFSDVLRKGGPQELLSRLEAKNAESAAATPSSAETTDDGEPVTAL